MVRIHRFSAVRPDARAAPGIAAVPYDVVTAEEAAACIRQNPFSFLRVSRSDAELPDLSPRDDRVYLKARETFHEFLDRGCLRRDSSPGLYLYRVSGKNGTFLGLAACVPVSDYEEENIRRHELTRYDKEEDRTRHIDVVNAHSGPVVLLFRDPGGIHRELESLASRLDVPDATVSREDGSVHQIFCITGEEDLARIEALFAGVDRLYIADGHHRAKSAVNVARKRKAEGRLTPESTRFLSVLFSHDRVRIHGYSRMVTDLSGMTPDEFMDRLTTVFSVEVYGAVDPQAFQIAPKAPSRSGHILHMYLGGVWYECSRKSVPGTDPIETLDVSVLQNEVLTGILGISDPRGDSRLQYLGGARPLADLEEMVDREGYAVAFSMQPVQIETVLGIADAGGIMPPKSTWFEPKLLSGLVVHTLD